MTSRKLPDPDTHLMITGYYKRLRSSMEKLSTYAFQQVAVNTKILNFIPHLKRTDRDVGGLPLYAKQYTSTKPNSQHALLCLISMLVQVFWDIRDGTLELAEGSEGGIDELDVFDANLAKLEGIAKAGLNDYRMHGKAPNFELLTKIEIEKREEQEELSETEELKQERAECDKIEKAEQQRAADATEAKGLMDAELGESGSSTVAAGDSENTQEDATDTSDLDQSPSTDADQLSVEDADKCCENCDSCVERVCEQDDQPVPDEDLEDIDDDVVNDGDHVAEPEREDNIEGGIVGADTHIAEQIAEGEHYPDTAPLENGIANATPPMPEDEE